MPIVIQEKFKNTNKKKDKVGGGGMDIAKTTKKKKPVKAMMGKSMKMKKK
tara:strand:- start:154 stop:303 length:150 start_codon:yes stop_codon:yes gene_type:complete